MFAEGRCCPAVSCPTYAAQLEEVIPVLSSKRPYSLCTSKSTGTGDGKVLTGSPTGTEATRPSLLPPSIKEEETVLEGWLQILS